MCESVRRQPEQANRIVSQDSPLVGIGQIGMFDPSPLHGRVVQGRIGSEQRAVDPDLAHDPLDQARHDRPRECTGRNGRGRQWRTAC